MVIVWLAESVSQAVVKGLIAQSRAGSSGTSMVSSRQWSDADVLPCSVVVAVTLTL